MYAASEVIAADMIANHSQDISLMTVIKDQIGFLQDDMEADDYALRMWMLWYYFGWAYGDELKDVGFRSMFDEIDPKSVFTPADCLNKEGFQTLFIKMSEPFKEKVRLSTSVTAIDYSQTLSRLTLSNGDVVVADKVIVTVPDAVLASGAVSFTPALPGMYPLLWSFSGRAQYLKIFLHFPTYFWESIGDREFWAYTFADVEGFYPSFQNLNFPDYSPGSNILVATVTGDEGRRLSAMTDSAVQAEVMTVIRKIFPDAPNPDGILTNKWYQDSLSKSVWSGTTINAFPSVRLAYRMPIDEKVYFAGEWTADEYNGYVHGALYTGRDQAAAIFNCINQTQPIPASSESCEAVSGSSSVSSLFSLLSLCFVVVMCTLF